MKKVIFISLLALTLAPIAGAIDRLPANVTPGGVTVVVPEAAIDNAPPLEVITIVHYKKDFVKPDQPGRGNKAESCYGFISGLAKLIATEDVLINASGSGLNAVDVLNDFTASALTWDNETAATIFGSFTLDNTANFDSIADSRNEISFGNYSQDGVIAVTRVWGYFSGKPQSRYISQFDMIFDTDYVWGDAELNPALMDFRNIAVHELGHTLGLTDIYTTTCQEVTMYGYSDNGETKKRTLEAPDIAGLETLYGI